MARRKTATPEVESAPEQDTTKMSDEDILKAIQAEFDSRPKPPAPKRVTITDLYSEIVSLVCSVLGYREVKLRQEGSAVKLMELTLMWALNQRAAPGTSILPTDEVGDVDEVSGEGEPPIPHEVIEAAPDQSEE